MKNALFSFMLLLLVLSASSQTLIMKDLRFLREPIEKVAVLTQIPDESLQLAVEESILTALDKKGIAAMNAYDFLIRDSVYLYSSLEREFTNNAIDGILI